MSARPGAKHHSAKLTNVKVRTARKHHADGTATTAQLAKRYGVSWPAMHSAITGHTWKHVT